MSIWACCHSYHSWDLYDLTCHDCYSWLRANSCCSWDTFNQVKYLYGDVQKAGGDAVRFYADDVVYEDMNYETPFVGKSAVEGFLKRS